MNYPLKTLLERMPELEWQLSKHAVRFSPKSLPQGLFRQPHDAPAPAYVAEIKADIATLSRFPADSAAAHYLALKISQKINVLVGVSALRNRQKVPVENVSYDMKKISTRQQWLQSLEADMEILVKQKEALERVIAALSKEDSNTRLNLAREFGELEKRLTLARETYAKATG